MLDDETVDKKKKKKRKSNADSFVIDDTSDEERIRKRKGRKVSGLLYDMDVSLYYLEMLGVLLTTEHVAVVHKPSPFCIRMEAHHLLGTVLSLMKRRTSATVERVRI